jgi:hypothetical protein
MTRSLAVYEKMPPTKLFLRSQFQNMVADEIVLRLLPLQPQARTVLMAVGLKNRIRTRVINN